MSYPHHRPCPLVSAMTSRSALVRTDADIVDSLLHSVTRRSTTILFHADTGFLLPHNTDFLRPSHRYQGQRLKAATGPHPHSTAGHEGVAHRGDGGQPRTSHRHASIMYHTFVFCCLSVYSSVQLFGLRSPFLYSSAQPSLDSFRCNGIVVYFAHSNMRA